MGIHQGYVNTGVVYYILIVDRTNYIIHNIELRCSASRVYRSLAVAYPGFFSGCCPDPPPAHLFFRRQRDWAGPIWKPPFRPVVDTPLLVFCCLSYIKKNMSLSKPSIPCVILTTSIWSPRTRLVSKVVNLHCYTRSS